MNAMLIELHNVSRSFGNNHALIDVNLAMGNLLDTVGRQAKAWAMRRP